MRWATYSRVSDPEQAKVEKKSLSMRLIDYVGDGQCDAVMGYHENRVARKLSAGLMLWEAMKDNGVKFFIRHEEIPLNSHRAKQAFLLKQVFYETDMDEKTEDIFRRRVQYAKEGLPSAGAVPWGRKWISTGKRTGRYEIDLVPDPRSKDNTKLIPADELARRMAEQYLNGETFEQIGNRIGWDLNTVRRRLYASGGLFIQNFTSPDGKDVERIHTQIPALLEEATIKAVKARASENQLIRARKAGYPLAGFVRCWECGSVLSGHGHSKQGWRYYRHHLETRRKYKCQGIKGVPADAIEDAVLHRLWAIYGSAKNLKQAVADGLEATYDGRTRLTHEREDLLQRIADYDSQRKKLANRSKDASDDEWKNEIEVAAKEVSHLKSEALERLADIESQLPHVDIPPDLADRVDRIMKRLKNLHTWDTVEKAQLVKMFLGSRIYRRKRREGDGFAPEEPRGIFVRKIEPKQVVGKVWRKPDGEWHAEREGPDTAEAGYEFEIRGALGYVPPDGKSRGQSVRGAFATSAGTLSVGAEDRRTDQPDDVGPIDMKGLANLAEASIYRPLRQGIRVKWSRPLFVITPRH